MEQVSAMDATAFIEALGRAGRWQRPPGGTGPVWTLSAVGDTAAVGGVGQRLRAGQPVYAEGVSEALQADLMLVNFEMSLQPASPAQPPPGLCAPPDLVDALLAPGFHVALLANNHVTDAGRDGLQATLQYLEGRGLAHVGAGLNLAEACRPLVREIGGVRVAVAAFAQPEANAAGPDQPGVAPLRVGRVLAALEDLRAQADVVVLSLHEGYEFTRLPRLEFKHNCHRFADAGAQVILGHHPHVPQGIELYRGAVIFYSLGNFLFDLPYHREYEYTRQSFITHLTFAGRELVAVECRPVRLTADHQVRLMGEADRRRFLAFLHDISLEVREDEEVAAFNAEWVQEHLLPTILRAIYAFGTRGDEEGFRRFLDRQIRRCDPYLKGMKDFVRYRLAGEPLEGF